MFSQCRSERVNCTHKAMSYMFSYFSQTMWGTILVCVCVILVKNPRKKNSNNFPKVCTHTHTYTHTHNTYSKILTLKFWYWSPLKSYWSFWKTVLFCISYLLLSMKKIKLYAHVYVGLGIGSFMETKMTYKSYLDIQVSFYNCITILSKSIKKGTVNNSTCATELELIVD